MMIRIENVQKSFDQLRLFEEVHMSVAEGEKVSLIGPGGSGKSVLLKMMLGLIQPDAGEVEVFGTDMVHATDKQRLEIFKKIGVAFQQGALFDFMSVHHNLKFAMDHTTNLSHEEKKERITRLLEGVKLGAAEHKYPYELSGGMQRRVGIARALSVDPKLAIFDEPTSGLDPVTSSIILKMISDLAANNDDVTLLIATSNVEIAIRFSERVIVLHEGRIIADGPWRDLLVNGSDWVKNFLSVRLIGLDREYAEGLDLPSAFVESHW